jgi:glycosyltransferase involved in cell wall biosynthesis
MVGWSERYRGKLKQRFLLTNLRTLRHAWGADVVFSTFTYGAVLYGLLRRVVRRGPRLVTVVHGLPPLLRRPGVFAAVYGGHDVLAFLSPADLAAVRPALPARVRAAWVPWGPSEEWLGRSEDVPIEHLLPPAALGRGFALALGRSKRDWETLAEAQRRAGFPLVVVAASDCPVLDSDAVRVHRSRPEQREAISLAEVLSLYRHASVLLLPLVEDPSLNGLTALGEALASGHVVVMSDTTAMGPFAREYPGWVVPVPVGDADALAQAVEEALAGPPSADRLQMPTAERFEDFLLAALRD